MLRSRANFQSGDFTAVRGAIAQLAGLVGSSGFEGNNV